MLVACQQSIFDVAKGKLDAPVIANGPRSKSEVDAWHAAGARIFMYANPQVGNEQPAVYRQNYGLDLLLAGYDGAMDYAYQHAFGNIWNDFDDKDYRDHVFAYPTTHGVVDTVQWEGFREAVDDVRYLSTLIALDHSRSKEQIFQWAKGAMTNGLAPAGCNRVSSPSMAEVREAIIEEILKVQGQ